MDTNEKAATRPSTRKWLVAGVLGLGVVIFIVWLSTPAAVPIRNAWIHQEMENVVELEVATCHGNLSVSTVEGVDEVRLAVKDNRFRLRLYGDDCADVVQVELDRALDGRVLFDETTGMEIEVRTDF